VLSVPCPARVGNGGVNSMLLKPMGATYTLRLSQWNQIVPNWGGENDVPWDGACHPGRCNYTGGRISIRAKTIVTTVCLIGLRVFVGWLGHWARLGGIVLGRVRLGRTVRVQLS